MTDVIVAFSKFCAGDYSDITYFPSKKLFFFFFFIVWLHTFLQHTTLVKPVRI